MAYHMPHMSHINDAYHLLLTSLIWRSNAGCCLWFRNWTNETLKTRFVYHINYALGLTTGFTFAFVSWTWTWTYCHSSWVLQSHCHFLNFFRFCPFSQMLWVFLTQNYFSDFIFIESKKWTYQSDPIIFNWQVAGRLRERIWLWV